MTWMIGGLIGAIATGYIGAAWFAQDAYALKDSAPVVQLNERMRYLHLPHPDAELLKCPALYVELERRADAGLIGARFRKITRLDSLTRSHARVSLATYAVYLSEGLDPATLR